MNIDWGQAGIIGVVLVFVLLLTDKYTGIFKFMRGDSKTKAIENNTQAMESLKNFLEKQAAVNDEKDEQRKNQLDRIEVKLDRHMENANEHYTRCKSTCLKG
jgi:ribosomal protein L9